MRSTRVQFISKYFTKTLTRSTGHTIRNEIRICIKRKRLNTSKIFIHYSFITKPSRRIIFKGNNNSQINVTIWSLKYHLLPSFCHIKSYKETKRVPTLHAYHQRISFIFTFFKNKIEFKRIKISQDMFIRLLFKITMAIITIGSKKKKKKIVHNVNKKVHYYNQFNNIMVKCQ